MALPVSEYTVKAERKPVFLATVSLVDRKARVSVYETGYFQDCTEVLLPPVRIHWPMVSFAKRTRAVMMNGTGVGKTMGTVMVNGTGVGKTMGTVMVNDTGVGKIVGAVMVNDTGVAKTTGAVMVNDTGVAKTMGAVMKVGNTSPWPTVNGDSRHEDQPEIVNGVIGNDKRREAGKSLRLDHDYSHWVVTIPEPENEHFEDANKETSVQVIDFSGASAYMYPISKERGKEKIGLKMQTMIGCPLVVFCVGLSTATNVIIIDLKKSGLGKEKMMHVLMKVGISCYNNASTDMEENQKLKLILLEQRLLSSPAGSSQQSRILRELMIEFVIFLEGQLQRGLVPHSDAKMVTLLPFRADMRDYIPNMSFFVLQVSFPVSLLKKRIALLLLASRVLYTSLEDSLVEVMCEDQALVMQRSSAFLVTENHAIEALIQFSQLQNVFWYIVSYNSEKCSVEKMEKVQDKLQQNFRDEFPSKEFSIEPLNACQQQPSNESTEPKEIQPIKTAVEESQSDSGQIFFY